MIEYIQLLRNIGKFDAVTGGTQLSFSHMTLLYSGNGGGKTTLAAIFRSLGNGDGNLITQRRRLSSTHAPHVVINLGTSHIFQNGQWSSLYPHFAVFDDAFIAENVCSGIEIEAEHRQNLHELILGAQGVSLNSTLQAHVAAIEQHNKNLKTRDDAIPTAERGGLTVEAFCGLKARSDIATLIQQAERSLAAARSSQAVAEQAAFLPLTIPAFDRAFTEALLQRDLPSLDATAAARVQSHISTLGRAGETWVSQGMGLVPAASAEKNYEVCPFCAQNLDSSSVMQAYRAYFSDSYKELKGSIDAALASLSKTHGADVPAAFERAVRVASQRREFWKAFVDLPELTLDTAAIARVWSDAHLAVQRVLTAKKTAPLEPMSFTAAELQALSVYERAAASLAASSALMQEANPRIAIVKEQAATANVPTLVAELSKLRATQARHSPSTNALCQAYLNEKAAKKVTEGLRDMAREALDIYRINVFPAYENAINTYLEKFGATFRLSSVCSVNNRGGSSCSYYVLINNVSVAITGSDGDPCFKNTLSAGDRNTLALAFFFSSLDLDPYLAQKIVVIDDPMTSLDEHRSLRTVQETGRLVGRVHQVLVLSHSKPFLCSIWKGSDKNRRAALRLIRDGDGSTLATWDVNQDLITEHDRRHATVRTYIQGQQVSDERAVATALRHILESFARVAYPGDFTPGSLLGKFHEKCDLRKGTATEILSAQDTIKLRDLLDYANRFHHETNPAYETAHIDDQELLDFSRRVLSFTSK